MRVCTGACLCCPRTEVRTNDLETACACRSMPVYWMPDDCGTRKIGRGEYPGFGTEMDRRLQGEASQHSCVVDGRRLCDQHGRWQHLQQNRFYQLQHGSASSRYR